MVQVDKGSLMRYNHRTNGVTSAQSAATEEHQF